MQQNGALCSTPGMYYTSTDGRQKSSLHTPADCSPLEKHGGHSPGQLSAPLPPPALPVADGSCHCPLQQCCRSSSFVPDTMFCLMCRVLEFFWHLGRGRVKKGPESCGNREVRAPWRTCWWAGRQQQDLTLGHPAPELALHPCLLQAGCLWWRGRCLRRAPSSFTQNSMGTLSGTRAKWKSLTEHLGRVGIAAKSTFLLWYSVMLSEYIQ